MKLTKNYLQKIINEEMKEWIESDEDLVWDKDDGFDDCMELTGTDKHRCYDELKKKRNAWKYMEESEDIDEGTQHGATCDEALKRGSVITKSHLRKIINEEAGHVLETMDEAGMAADVWHAAKEVGKDILRDLDSFIIGPDWRKRLGAIEALVADKKSELEGADEGADETYGPLVWNSKPEEEEREVEPEDPQRAADRAERVKDREATERGWAAEIRAKMKQYPPTKPMRPEIADLLDRYPEEEDQIKIDEGTSLKKRDKNRHKWDWEHSDLPVCKGEDTENCIPKAMATKFRAAKIKRKSKKRK